MGKKQKYKQRPVSPNRTPSKKTWHQPQNEDSPCSSKGDPRENNAEDIAWVTVGNKKSREKPISEVREINYNRRNEDPMWQKHRDFFYRRSINKSNINDNELKWLLRYAVNAEKQEQRNTFLTSLLKTEFLRQKGPVFHFLDVETNRRETIPEVEFMADDRNDVNDDSLDMILDLTDEILDRIPHATSAFAIVEDIYILTSQIPHIHESIHGHKIELLRKNLYHDLTLLTNKVNDPTHAWRPNYAFIGQPTLPTVPELMTGNLPKVFANRIDKPYSDTIQYVETWFRLMREDFCSPLRTAIRKYKSLLDGQKNGVTRLDGGYFYQFRVREHLRQKNKTTVRLDFTDFICRRLKHVDWGHTDRLMAGSLLLLSNDDFETGQYAVVEHHDHARRDCGEVQVSMMDNQELKNSGMLIGIQPEPFWESYRHVLERLKVQAANISQQGQLPLENYLIRLDRKADLPEYLIRNGNPKLSLRIEGKPTSHGEISEMNLDESQKQAVELALNNEICAIQGPPGTGKSYVGAHLVDTLLLNKHVWQKNGRGCILLLAFKNHAIDQFVSECERLNMDMSKTVRLGGGGNEDMKKKYSIYERWQKMKHLPEFKDMKIDHHSNQREIERLNRAIEATEKCMCEDWNDVPFHCYILFIPTDIQEQLRVNYTKVRQAAKRSTSQMETQLSESTIKQWLREGNQAKSYPMVDGSPRQNLEALNSDEAEEIDDITDLDRDTKLRLLAYWCTSAQEEAERFIFAAKCWKADLEKKRLSGNLRRDMSVVRDSNIIAMTTTGACKYSQLLETAKPVIVLVEEAAEVLESHIVAPLTTACEHLILIGDHQQLRPSIAEHRLVVEKRNLEISLFERLINNQLPHTCLKVQHRMHPEIAQILVPNIYSELQHHDRVKEYPSVCGLKKRLTLMHHKHRERGMGEKSSKTNQFEAEFLVALCRYILQHGYNPEDITILTTYMGQMRLIRTLIRSHKMDDVLVQTVDNYQGEENKIILLSFVRSNEENRIGFLKHSNRICVALSRAQHGFYAVGDFLLFAEQSEIWKKLRDQLSEEVDPCLTPTLPLFCETHNETFEVASAEDFKLKFPEGGCANQCDARLKCGHRCRRRCHTDDPPHVSDESKCLLSCPGRLDCGHECNTPCARLGEDQTFSFQAPSNVNTKLRLRTCEVCEKKIYCIADVEMQPDCGHRGFINCSATHLYQCQVRVDRTLPCGHYSNMECSEDPTKMKCRTKVTRSGDCGHETESSCHKQSLPPCSVMVMKTKVQCGHKVEVKCSGTADYVSCNQIVDLNLPCGHVRQVECRLKDLPYKCKELVKKTPPNCEHERDAMCHQADHELKCNRQIELTLKCGHEETIPCDQYTKTGPPECQKLVPKIRSCGHTVKAPCSQSAEIIQCDETTIFVPECQHPMSVKCHLPISQRPKCKELISKQLQCGHNHHNIECWAPTDNIICDQTVEKELKCGHKKYLKCSAPTDNMICDQPVEKELKCGHKKYLKCSAPTDNVICDQPVEKELKCGHKKYLKCSAPTDNVICDQTVEKELKCGHKTSLKCSAPTDNIICDQTVEKELKCGHKKYRKCSAPTRNMICDQRVEKELKCGHKTSLKCWQSGVIPECRENVFITARCGHLYQVECSKKNETDNINCPRDVKIKLSCGHTKRVKCHETANTHECTEIVDVTANCGHTQRVECQKRNALDKIKCTQQVVIKLPCAHKKTVTCCISRDTVECTQTVAVTASCGHSQDVECRHRDKKLPPCPQISMKIMKCGHTVEVKCGTRDRDIECRQEKTILLECGHEMTTRCNYTRMKLCEEMVNVKPPCGKHKHSFAVPCHTKSTAENEPCKKQTSRVYEPCKHSVQTNCGQLPKKCPKLHKVKLQCGHDGEVAGNDESLTVCTRMVRRNRPCRHFRKIPCNESLRGHCPDPCKLICSHGNKCRRKCSERCHPCSRPCPLKCPHGRCGKRCFEQCDRQPCDEPCGLFLPCGHTCRGFCGEPCPKYCPKCLNKSNDTKRYVQIQPCDHYFPVQDLDQYMRTNPEEPKLCLNKKCKKLIVSCPRYSNIIKVYSLSFQNVDPGNPSQGPMMESNDHEETVDEEGEEDIASPQKELWKSPFSVFLK